MPTSDGGLSGMEAAAYLHSAGFSGDALQIAIAIGKAESGLKMIRSATANSNGSYDWGFMQINDVHKPSDAVKTDPLANARAAFGIYSAAGHKFTPWSTYNSGAYKANMEFARQSVHALQAAGPKYERDLIAGKHPGSKDNPITLDPPGGGAFSLPGGASLSDVPKAISSGINALSTQFNKVAGNFMSILIAVVLIVLGIVILSRRAVVDTVKTVGKVVP